MPTTPDARHRLAELMEDRRLELGLRWQDVVDAATAAGFKVSLKALHSVRTGTAGLRPLTQRGIEAGLRWEPGSVQAIEDGGDPVPLPDDDLDDEPVTGPIALADVFDFAEKLNAARNKPFEDQVRAEIREARARYRGVPLEEIPEDSTDPLPASAIPGFDTIERFAWDKPGVSEAWRVDFIATYRMKAASQFPTRRRATG